MQMSGLAGFLLGWLVFFSPGMQSGPGRLQFKPAPDWLLSCRMIVSKLRMDIHYIFLGNCFLFLFI